ncbi:hypothetical protein T484DRAFT_1818510, partial [Baffinella frigidus]
MPSGSEDGGDSDDEMPELVQSPAAPRMAAAPAAAAAAGSRTNGAAGGSSLAGFKPGFLDGNNNRSGAPRQHDSHQWAGRLPRDACPVLPANVFKRVIAPPGRGAHVRLEKALEGIVALMGRTNYDKDYPCNSTALRALVVCMHAGPSWGYPGDENQQAPLACDVGSIMEFLTERIARQPKAKAINIQTIITRSRLVRAIKEMMFLHLRCYSESTHQAWLATWRSIGGKVPEQKQDLQMGTSPWMWMKRHQFIMHAERDYNITALLIEDFCCLEEWAIANQKLGDESYLHQRWLRLDTVRLWCTESWPSYGDIKRYPELARIDGMSVAYELIEKVKNKIQDQEVWYRWVRSFADSNNSMSGQVMAKVMTKFLKEICHKGHLVMTKVMTKVFKELIHKGGHIVDQRLKQSGWECFKTFFAELNNGRSPLAGADAEQNRRKIDSVLRSGDCGMKLVGEALVGRKVSWFHPLKFKRLYGKVLWHRDDGSPESKVRIQHDEPLDNEDAAPVMSYKWSDIAFDMLLHEDYNGEGLCSDYPLEFDAEANLELIHLVATGEMNLKSRGRFDGEANLDMMIGTVELCKTAVEVLDVDIHRQAYALLIHLCSQSDEFAGLVVKKLATPSTFARRDENNERIQKLTDIIRDAAIRNATDPGPDGGHPTACSFCKENLTAVGQFAPRVFRGCKTRSQHVVCFQCVNTSSEPLKRAYYACPCTVANGAQRTTSAMQTTHEYFGLSQARARPSLIALKEGGSFHPQLAVSNSNAQALIDEEDKEAAKKDKAKQKKARAKEKKKMDEAGVGIPDKAIDWQAGAR